MLCSAAVFLFSAVVAIELSAAKPSCEVLHFPEAKELSINYSLCNFL